MTTPFSRLTPAFLAPLLAAVLLPGCDGGSPTPSDQTVDRLVFSAQPTSAAAGAVIDPAVQVELVDAAGSRVTSAEPAVTLTIGTNPAGGTLEGTTTVSAVAGVASFSGLWIDRAGTGYTLEAATSGISPATSSGFDISHGPASELLFTTQPSDTTRGSVITPAVEVEARDEFGNPATTFTDTVGLTLDSNPGQGALLGTTSSAAVNGVATFPDLALDSAGAGYRLQAASGDLTAAVSDPFDITLVRADQDLDGDGYSPNQGDCDDEDSSVFPGADDSPDGAYLDTNCDGVDGDAAVATFVAPTGQDTAGCGALESPCATPQAGLTEAQAAGDRDLYIMAGAYDAGAVFLADGINVYGGFNGEWARDGTDTTSIFGDTAVAVVTGASEAVTLVADGLTQPTVVADLKVIGPDAVGTHTDGGGKSSYAFWVKDVAADVLTIEGSTFVAGDGAPGAAGSAGEDAAATSATSGMHGGNGGSAAEFSTLCNDTDSGQGGASGTNPAAAGGRNPDAGAGGDGGTMDTDCSSFIDDLDAQPGQGGFNAAYWVSPYGVGGSGGSTCQPGQPGSDGRITNGPSGAGGTGGRVSTHFWIGQNGTSGGTGDNGSGGGGGGGSGGCDTDTDEYGAGGGGGGAGGVRAVSGGGGAGGGGGSFGLYLVNASPTVRNNSFVRGAGGDGGNGGTGGRGQSGGSGGFGGNAAGDTGPGGAGGDGGHGGHGGGGGGGAGGISAGVFALSSGPVLEGNTFTGGTAGAAGSGGVSAPTAPTDERDGNDGAPGAPGAVETVVTRQ